MVNKEERLKRYRYLKLKAKVDAAQVPKEKKVEAPVQPTLTVSEAVFPRASKAVGEGQPYYKQALGAGLDLLSGPGRAIRTGAKLQAGGDVPYYQGPMTKMEFPKDTDGLKQKALQLLSELEGDSFIENLAIDPGTGAALLTLPITGPLAAGGKLAGAIGAGAIEGGASAAAHQAEGVVSGQGIDPAGAALETGFSAAMPGLFSVVGKGLKKAAPGMLRSAVKPARKYTEKTNPPNFVKPLEDKLITAFGGLEKGIERTSDVIGDLATQRDNLIASKNIKVNITDAIRKVGRKLNDMVKNKEIDFEDAEGAFKHAVGARKTAKKISKGKAKKIIVSGEDAIGIRKLADQNSKFNPFKSNVQNPNKVVFSEAYRRVLEDEIENALFKSSGLVTKTKYKRLKKEMADLIPFQKAGQFRLGQLGNNYQFSLMDLSALGVGGVIGGPNLAGRLGAAAGVGTLRRLTQTPGGARMLYDVGKRMSTPSPVFMPSARQVVRGSMRPKQKKDTVYSPIDEPKIKINTPKIGPLPGTIEDGYKFKGGNPANKKNWELVY